MCGRYSSTKPIEDLQAEFDLAERPDTLLARYNIAPTQEAPVVVQDASKGRALRLFRWGLIPRWAEDARIGSRQINARAETVSQKRSYRESLERRRCLVAADGFYEWQTEGKRKLPLHIRKKSGLLAFAGLWDTWTAPNGLEVSTYTIITSAPNTLVAPIHNRMPVIVPPEQYERWLSLRPLADAELALLLAPYARDDLEAARVGDAVNHVDVDGPECLLPPKHPVPLQTRLFD